MKNEITLLILSAFVFINSSFAQSGEVTYQDKIKFQFEMETSDDMPGMDLSSMLPQSQTTIKKLVFNKTESLYQEDKSVKRESMNKDIEVGDENNMIKIEIKEDDTRNIRYTNLKDKKQVHLQGFMGKEFLIKDDLEKLKWKITADQLVINGYTCQKATTTNSDEKEVVAWFTTEIPIQHGPSIYHGLPGLILSVSIDNGKHEIAAINLELREVNAEEVVQPDEGKKVNREKFKKIIEEKTKEMREQFGGKGEMIIIGG